MEKEKGEKGEKGESGRGENQLAKMAEKDLMLHHAFKAKVYRVRLLRKDVRWRRRVASVRRA